MLICCLNFLTSDHSDHPAKVCLLNLGTLWTVGPKLFFRSRKTLMAHPLYEPFFGVRDLIKGDPSLLHLFNQTNPVLMEATIETALRAKGHLGNKTTDWWTFNRALTGSYSLAQFHRLFNEASTVINILEDDGLTFEQIDARFGPTFGYRFVNRVVIALIHEIPWFLGWYQRLPDEFRTQFMVSIFDKKRMMKLLTMIGPINKLALILLVIFRRGRKTKRKRRHRRLVL